MTLKDYKEEQDLNYDQLAEFLDISRGTVFNICRNRGCCSLPNAHQIVTKTLGAVDYVDLLGDC